MTVEASIAASASSGASNSGATDQSGGGNYGGTNYGPGSLILGNDSSPAKSPLVWIIAIVAAAVVTFFIFRKGGK